ncbi:MAG TPA: hypothetical protein VKR06_00460 [Ktedonosporobacter sp.]|nr:hypothetical protein [Ktedonosporobacter sp.]
MLRTLRQGLLAGGLAGLFIALLFFVDTSPGNGFHRVAQWLALDSQTAGKFVGFLLLLLLSLVFGMLFGVVARRMPAALGVWLLTGLAIGALWWIIVVLFLGMIIHHVPLTFGAFLSTSIPLLVYGIVLGSLSFLWRQPGL